MGKGNKKDTENLEEWILSFERLARKPVVVSLLVQEGNIEFINCTDKNRFLDYDDEEESNEHISLKDLENQSIINSKLNIKDYIG